MIDTSLKGNFRFSTMREGKNGNVVETIDSTELGSHRVYSSISK